MEVAQIARGIVYQLLAVYSRRSSYTSALPDIPLIETIGFGHDLGHPPFGHGGEVALNYMMRDNGGFEGNGHSLRLLARLENHTESFGLDLTRRALLGILKYPAPFSHVCPNTMPAPVASISQLNVYGPLHLGDNLFLNAWTTAATIVVSVPLLYWSIWRRVHTKVMSSDGKLAAVRTPAIDKARLVGVGESWGLDIGHDGGRSTLTGKDAVRAIAALLAGRNQNGATAVETREALDLMERIGGSEKVFSVWVPSQLRHLKDTRLFRLPLVDRLMLEMAANEEVERRVLAGEHASMQLGAGEAQGRARIVEEMA